MVPSLFTINLTISCIYSQKKQAVKLANWVFSVKQGTKRKLIKEDYVERLQIFEQSHEEQGEHMGK